MHRYKRGRAKSGRSGKGQGETPQTSARHRTVQGTQERQESSPKEALKRAANATAAESSISKQLMPGGSRSRHRSCCAPRR
jgi:hypothetical protein